MKAKKKSAPSAPAWLRHGYWLTPLLAILVYLPAFQAEFTFDDVPIIEENTLVRSTGELGTIWRSHYWAGKADAEDKGLYRPLTLTTYNLQYAMTGDRPGPFHIFNVLLHAAVCFLLMRMLALLFNAPWLAMATGLLFAVHPLHTEAVAGIVGRAELLAAAFMLFAMITYDRYRQNGKWPWLAGLALATAGAITSKEHGFVTGPLLVLQELYYFFSTRQKVPKPGRLVASLALVGLVSAILLVIRSGIAGDPAMHELWLGVSGGDRTATAMRIVMEYVRLHVVPLPLVADYWSDLAPIRGWASAGSWLGLFTILGLTGAAVYLRHKRPVAAWGIAFFLLTLLPVSNFLFAIGFIKAERILYIPSIGLLTAIVAGLLWLRVKPWGRWPATGIYALMILAFIPMTWMRATQWKNNFTLAEATLKVSPGNPRFNNMMGKEVKARGNDALALEYYQRAVAASPNHVPALVNLGLALAGAGRPQEAMAILEKALSLNPGNLPVYVNLMSVYRSLNMLEQNAALADRAVKQFPQSAAILWNAANAHQLLGDMQAAESLRARARTIDPGIDPAR